MARFEDQDLTDAEFLECDLSRARLIGVVMQDAIIDGLVSNLVVNGVEVMSYVEAALDRRHPVRPLMRSSVPATYAKPSGTCGPAGRQRWRASAARRRGWSTSASAANGPRSRRCATWSSCTTVVSSLLPRITSIVHRNWIGIGLRAGPGRAGPRSSGGT